MQLSKLHEFLFTTWKVVLRYYFSSILKLKLEDTIDLDILLYDDQQIKTRGLCVPHPGICQRDFVYLPLLKIKPDIKIPGTGLLNNMVKITGAVNSDFACQFVGNIDR